MKTLYRLLAAATMLLAIYAQRELTMLLALYFMLSALYEQQEKK